MRFEVGDKVVVKDEYITGKVTDSVNGFRFTAEMRKFPVVTIKEYYAPDKAYAVEENGAGYVEEFLQTEIKVGDKVKTITDEELTEGKSGRVAVIDGAGCLVDFGRGFDGHNGLGILKDSTGWWMSDAELVVINEAKALYKVGDKVKIRPELLDGKNHSDIPFTFASDMAKFPKVTIKSFSITTWEDKTVVLYKVKENSFNYADSAILEATDFEVGDRVNIKKALLDGEIHREVKFSFTPGMSRHPIVTIKSKHGDEFFVKESHGYNYSAEMFDTFAEVEIKDVKLEAKFKKGDLVRLRAEFAKEGYTDGEVGVRGLYINDEMVQRKPFRIEGLDAGRYDFVGSDGWAYRSEWLESVVDEEKLAGGYKIGDKVKIKAHLIEGSDLDVPFGFNSDMRCQRTVTITRMNLDEYGDEPIMKFFVAENSWTYGIAMFDGIASKDDKTPEESEFKVGDRVRLREDIKEGNHSGGTFVNATMAERTPFTIMEPKSSLSSYDWRGSDAYSYKSSWLEHCPVDEAKELTVAEISKLLGYEVKIIK